ncbi:MAG: protein-disulfide reductase DsbD family protein, partial [Burkholderiaceae bacterium]
GWGFQLQSPTVVALLALWFVVLGLQLAGLFEWGAVLPSAMSDMRWRRPSVEAAWSGVLATVAASPCTAPFMGAALGATLLMTTFESLLVVAALGVGMALPFMALAWWPGLTRRLPKPGAWMQTFKQFLAFPMLATSIWLVWVLGQQTGIGGAAALLLLMLAVAWVLWLWYRVTARHWRLVGLLLVLLGAFSLWPTVVQPLARAADPTVAQADAQGRWQAWSQAKVDAALARGESVFVDFTAAWCVTCQFNERTALAAPEVWQRARQSNVLMLRADWTSRDDAITRALAALGRSGVPTYALYRPNQPPVLLPELLTTSIVLAALPQ